MGRALPWTFTTDATSTYWSSFGTMSRCALAGCEGSPTIILEGPSNIHSLAANTKSVFWTDAAGVIASCPLAGCDGAPTVIGAVNAFTSVLAVDERHVYWIDPGTRIGGGKEGPVRVWLNGAVLACPVSSCGDGPTVLATYSSWLGGGALVVDDTDLYWSTGDPSSGSGQIVRCRIDGCGGMPTPIASTATPDPTPGLAVDAMNVYWTDPGRGAVMVAPK